MNMWRRRNDRSSLAEALRARRAAAPDELVERISARVAAAPVRERRVWSRLAFASAVSVFVVGTFASFGGLGYASSGASHTYSAVKQIAVGHELRVVVHKSSAAGEYNKPSTKPSAFAPPSTSKPAGVNAAVKTSGQTLPFTGFSLLGTFLASLGLIGAGLFLRQRERRSY
jgi:hypothetical protein